MANKWQEIGGFVAGGAGLLGIFDESSAADQQEKIAEMEEKQEEINGAQQGIKAAKQTQQVMAIATAQAASRGISSGSTNFQVVQNSTFDSFQKDKDMAALNLSLSRADLNFKKQQIRDRETSGILGTIGSLAEMAIMFA